MDELEVAMRDLEDEYSDGLITEEAYNSRKTSLIFQMTCVKIFGE